MPVPSHVTLSRSQPAARRGRSRQPLLATVGVVILIAGVLSATSPAAARPTPRPGRGAPLPGFGEPGIPVRPASERYVRETYEAILGRQVDEAGLSFWGERLDTGSSRGSHARQLVLSSENLRREVRAQYTALLDESPTDDELMSDIDAIQDGRLTLELLAISLVTSDEYLSGTDPESWVRALYADVLGRSVPPSDAEVEFWLERWPIDDAWYGLVANSFVRSVERVRPRVVTAYDRILARAADTPGRDHWVDHVRSGGSVLDVDRQLLASSELWGAGCSILDTTRCLLPFPNDELTLPDTETDTRRRVVLKPSWVPAPTGGSAFDPTEWNRQDGFSPGSAVLLSGAGVDVEESSLPPLDDIGASLSETSPIVIVDVDSGERWPFWAELDSNAPTDAERALILRPARNFLDGRTYAVGIGPLRDSEGDVLPVSSGFRTYRDELPSTSRRVNEGRPAAEAAIDVVVDAGLERDRLHLAWTFTTASTRNLAERIVHMRDETLGGVAGATAPDFTVTEVGEPAADGTTRVQGTFEVPLYLTGAGEPGSRLNLGPDDLPERNGTFTAPFVCTVPAAAATTPARASLYGHGLLGTGGQANSGYVRALAAEHNIVLCGTDYIGMSESDVPNTLNILNDLSRFPQLVDRNQQGLLNFMALGRLLTLPDGLVTHEAFQQGDGDPAVDGSDLFYYGLSQGGIMGGALTAVSPDIDRGVLGVPAMNYSTLLERSVDFDPFFAVLSTKYASALDRIMLISVIQMLWDRGEGNGYANHMTGDPLPGTPATEVLLQPAFGDHQVTQFAVNVQARTYGALTNDPPLEDGRVPDVEPLWGIERIQKWPHAGSALIYWDSGTPTPPYENVPPRPPDYGEDPHGAPRNDPDARVQISEFLKADGVVVDVCGGEPCLVDFE